MDERQSQVRATGSCLCGSIRFEIRGPLQDIVVCHCVFCQRSGTTAWTECRTEDLLLLAGKPKHYRSSPLARRGFCGKCGSQLFFEAINKVRMSVSAGSLDQPTGLRIAEHIFCEHLGDYEKLPMLPREAIVPWTPLKAG